MRKIIYIFLVGTLLAQCTPKVQKIQDKVMTEDFRANQPAPGPAPSIELGDYQKFSLDNGLQVIVVENSKVPQVSFRLFIDADPIMEKDKAGFAEFSGDLLSRGSKKRTKAQLDEEVDFIGANFSTFSGGFFASSLSKYTGELMEIATEAVFNPNFSEAEFEKIKTQRLSGLASEKDDPNAIAGNVRAVLNYGKNHPYGELVTEKTVGNISVQDCKNYYNANFRPGKAYLIFVGDIKLTEAKSMANKYFGSWEPMTLEEQDFSAVKVPTKRTVDFVHKSGAVQSVVSVTYPIDFKPNSPDLIKASVMNTMLGGFFRSRLNQNLREDHAYTYGVGSALSRDELMGSFRAGGSVRNEVTDSAVYQIQYEIRKMISEKISADELELVKSVMAGKFGRSLEDPGTMARFALNVARYNLPKNYYHDYLKNLDAVTADDVQRMAKKYLRPDACHILVVGDKNEVAEGLKQFGELHFYDTYGNPIKSDGPSLPALGLNDLMEKHTMAMGGKKALAGVKSIETEYTAEVQGTKLNVWNVKVDGKKLAMKVSMMGQVMQEQKYNDGKGVTIAQGQSKAMSDGELMENKFESYAFLPNGFSYLGDKVKMVGAEKVDGMDYYLVKGQVNGNTYLTFFDAKTFLVAKMEVMMGEGAEAQKMIMNFSDYTKKNGVMVAGKYSMSGVMPMALDFVLDKVEINGTIDNNWFTID